jgi:uncharacterized protein YndB with AHSA1/START domain
MSKKNKVQSVKAGKKTPVKKVVKKAVKPSAKKIAAKKSTTVKKTSKPIAKKIVPAKKIAKPIKKSTVAKKTVKAIKPIKAKVAKAVKVKTPKTKKPVVKVAPKKAVKVLKTKHVEPKKDKKLKEKKTKVLTNIGKPATKTSENIKAAEKEKKVAAEVSQKKLQLEKKATEVLAISNMIPVKEKNEISLSKIASISNSITNPIKKTDSYAVKPEKEPNGKFEMEFVVHSSAEMLYEFLSTPSGLSEWFCDDLNIRNGIYTFIWEDQLQQARLLKTIDLQLVRFQWVDKSDGSYFEFRIQRDDLTNDISLIITDFADTVGERESSKLLWHSQIEKLMHVIGSIF